MAIEPQHYLSVGATLGEGPLWHAGALWFTDIKERLLYRHRPGALLERWPAPDQIGWVQPAADGTMIAGLKSGLHAFDPGTGGFTPLVAIEPDRPGNRLNDSTVDPLGRLWFGSMDDAEAEPSGAIYRADQRGIVRAIDGICITNGPALSPDARMLYHCDTLGGTIWRCDLDGDGGIADARVFASVDVLTQGYPDGPIVDAEGFLWVGFFGGWCVRRYAADGRQVEEVRFPVANVTKIVIGGADGRTAFATTASKGLGAEERARQPMAGDVFTFAAGVAGQPATPVSTPTFTLIG